MNKLEEIIKRATLEEIIKRATEDVLYPVVEETSARILIETACRRAVREALREVTADYTVADLQRIRRYDAELGDK